MPENQNIEYKESWRDEYLKWICGFANAQGGIIYIGKNDKGKVVGLKDSKRLMTEIPNKIQATMGIVADVNLLEEKGLEYISIRVTPSSFPVSYHGEYHYRSGSTKQQLVGNALSQFIIEKTGVHWEDGIANNVSLDDLDHESISIFKKAVLRKGRMSEADLNVPDVELLDKLGLLENGGLKKSGALLFSKNPEKVQVGSFVKVGKFGEGPDLLYHDTIEGSLISIADKVIDLIFFKYLKAAISYEHDMRVEQYPFAREAVREAVYNAIAHNCYMSGVPIQIRIDDNSMTISNTCVFPTGWTVETLFKPHKSIPYNPSIAKAFYLAGYIENWGRGIQKICDECKKINASLPEYEILGNDLTVRFKALEEARVTDEGQTSGQVSGQVGGQVSEHVVKISKVSKVHNDTLKYKIINLIKQNPSITQKDISKNLKVSLVSIKRAMKQLVDSQKISRKGGKQKGSWIIEKSKESKVHDDTLNDTLEYKIINLIKQNPSITQKDISGNLKVSLVSVKRAMKQLVDSQKISRKDGKRNGYWSIN